MSGTMFDYQQRPSNLYSDRFDKIEWNSQKEKKCACGEVRFIDAIDDLIVTEQGGEGYGAYIECDVIKEPKCFKCFIEGGKD